MKFRIIIAVLIPLILFACNSGNQKSGTSKIPGRKELADLNRYMVAKDRERIESYIERKGLKMTVTQSGLWYMIKNEGSGSTFTENDRVKMEYDCTTLDGTLCYSSKETGPKEVVVGKTSIEPGLDQGLRMMKPGSEALFIIPPFLAWGFRGDGKRIPPRSTLVYNIKIIN